MRSLFSKNLIPRFNYYRPYTSNIINYAETPDLDESPRKIYPQRIFSGIQPTGQIHLGNYFGAVRQWVKFQNEKIQGKYDESIFCVVDLHAITLPQDPKKLRAASLEATATILACGIDPDKSVLFLQSQVALHTQLSWVLGCLTTMPRLGQLASFREKSKQVKDVPLGLFTYPVLQAADILLYNATHIPVGQDNLANVQIAQHLVKGFNRLYGETFAYPKPILETGMWSRLRSLRKPENKMSKSDPDPRSRICLQDSPEEIVEKIKKAVTDFTSEVTYDPEGRPGVSNLLEIHSLCSGQSPEEICQSVKHLDTGKYKAVIAEALVEYLRPIRKHLGELKNDPGYLLQVLDKGRQRAEELGMPQWEGVCSRVGFLPNFKSLGTGKEESDKIQL